MTSIQVKVTFENLAPDNGAVFSPQWFSFHDGTYDLFDPGDIASSAIELVAEDGLTGLEAQVPGFVEYLQALNFDFSRNPAPSLTVAGNFAASEAALNGGIQNQVTQFRPTNPTTIGQAPGEDASVIVALDNAEQQRYFSFLSMMFPTNDGFIANESPLEIEVFDESGNFIGADIIISGDQVWDAGTEINDESPESIPYTARTIGNGQAEGGVITLFPQPGFLPLGAGGILDSTDVFGDQVRFFTNADYTQPGYEVARLTISEVEIINGNTKENIIQGNNNDNSIQGFGGNDKIFGKAGDDQLSGGNRADTIFGGDDDDSLSGGKGDDSLQGQRGRDLIEGGSGNDTLIGGLDNDTLIGEKGDDFLQGNSQADFLLGREGADTLSGGRGLDVLLGGAGADQLWGGAGDDFLEGGKNKDTLLGGAGDDILNGSGGPDYLEGNSGDDQLIGGISKDTLDGGLGDDLLLGGDGRDFFVLREGDGVDTILDYQVKDRFILDNSLSFDELEISQGIGGTEIIFQNTQDIVILLPGVDASTLSVKHFITDF